MQSEPNYPNDCDIFIVGLGIVHVDQVTREVDRCLANSKEILFVERGLGIESYLRSRCPKITDLTKLYVVDGDRQATYRQMCAAVVKAAMENPPVSLALYGHPLVFAYPPFLVREMARYLGLRIKVFPGISAFDCLITDLFIDPSVNGIQMYEATELLLRRRPLQSDVPAVIWQVGSLETGLYSITPSNSERFTNFVRHMTCFYPKDHKIFAVHCATHPLLQSDIYEFSLSEMGDHASVLHAGFTLYVPPVNSTSTVDITLASKLSDIKHLQKITSG